MLKMYSIELGAAKFQNFSISNLNMYNEKKKKMLRTKLQEFVVFFINKNFQLPILLDTNANLYEVPSDIGT